MTLAELDDFKTRPQLRAEVADRLDVACAARQGMMGPTRSVQHTERLVTEYLAGTERLLAVSGWPHDPVLTNP
jgi:hypothetical protein